jgi:GNAT superfamily N-acetyltransferase
MITDSESERYSFSPLTSERWQDFASLFGERGACGGCWCMLWRLPASQFKAQKGDGNREAMRTIIDGGEVVGLLAYVEGKAVGWCAVAPRESYPALARSRILRPVDGQACWSVSCLFIEKASRGQGLSVELLRAACGYARECGAGVIEGYPIEPQPARRLAPAFAWTGLAAAFRAAGFVEVARRSATRPIMRRILRQTGA